MRIQEPTDDYNVNVANQMFIETGFKVDERFKLISKQTLNVTVTQLNFKDGLSASKSINHWVRDRTNGKSDQLMQPGGSVGFDFH